MSHRLFIATPVRTEPGPRVASAVSLAVMQHLLRAGLSCPVQI